MKKIIYFPVFIWLLLTTNGNAQILDAPFTELYNKFEFNQLFEEPDQNYAGSPYLETEFIPGEILMKNGTAYHNIPLRFNVYNDIFEFKHEDSAWALDTAVNYSRINIGDKSFMLTPYTYGENIKKGHMEIMRDGDFTLLKRYRIDFVPPTKAEPYKDPKPATFRNSKPDYFVLYEGTAIFFNSEKSLARACGYNQEELKKYVKENKISFRKEESLVKLFTYLNNKQE